MTRSKKSIWLSQNLPAIVAPDVIPVMLTKKAIREFDFIDRECPIYKALAKVGFYNIRVGLQFVSIDEVRYGILEVQDLMVSYVFPRNILIHLVKV